MRLPSTTAERNLSAERARLRRQQVLESLPRRNYEDEPFSEAALLALPPSERFLAQHINALNKEVVRLNALVLSIDQTMRRNIKK